MAAESSQAPSSDTALSGGDLGTLYDALYPARNKYKPFGLQIGVGIEEIYSVETQHSDPGDRLLGVLTTRLTKLRTLTWNDVDRALRRESVGESKTADNIRKALFPDLKMEGAIAQKHKEQKNSGRKKRKQKKAKGEVNDKQGEDSDLVVKSKKHSQQPEESDEESSATISEEREEKEVHKVRGKREISPPRAELAVHAKKRKNKKERSKKRCEPQIYERKEQKERERSKKEQRKPERDEFLETPSDSYEYQSDDEIVKSRRCKRKKQIKVKPGNESKSAMEMASSPYSEKKPKEYADNKSESKEVKMHKRKEKEREKVSQREYYRKSAAASNEQEKYPDREVSEKSVHKPKKIQPESESDDESSSTSTGEEETSEVTGFKRPPPKYKALGTHTKPKHKKAQVKNDQKEFDSSEMQSDSYEYQSDDEITKSKIWKRKKQAKVKPGNESKSVKEMASSPYSEKRGELKKSECTEVKMQKRKKNEREKLPQREYYQKVAAARDEREKISDREVGEKPVLKTKIVQQKSESENESSSTSTGEEGTSEVTGLESTPQIYRASATHTGQKQQNVRPKNYEKEIENRTGKLVGKKKMPQEKLEKEEACCYPKKEKYSKDKKSKRATQVLSEKAKVLIPLDCRESVKTQGNATEKQTELAGKKAAGVECASDNTLEDFEDEESDSDDSSEDEEDRDSEEESSNEEEETEPDYESSLETSEDAVKKMSLQSMPLAVNETEDAKNEGKEKKIKVVADVPYTSCDDKQSDASGKNKEPEPKPKKKKRRHRESSMSPTARGSSSPSTSLEDCQNQPRPKGKGTKQGKQKRKSTKRHKQPLSQTSSEIDSSSPECDMGNGLSETEKKKLSGIFSRFFGKLCCAIVNPVEIAAQLQEKRLISKATMIEMLKSPESQQDKTIGLVSKLNKKMESHPDCLFEFIELLLQSDVLQRAGNEMLKQAGK